MSDEVIGNAETGNELGTTRQANQYGDGEYAKVLEALFVADEDPAGSRQEQNATDQVCDL